MNYIFPKSSKDTPKFSASMTVDGTTTEIGTFDSEVEAAKAYDERGARANRTCQSDDLSSLPNEEGKKPCVLLRLHSHTCLQKLHFQQRSLGGAW